MKAPGAGPMATWWTERVGRMVIAALSFATVSCTMNPGEGNEGEMHGLDGGHGSKSLPEPEWKPAGTRTTWNNLTFLVPQGMQTGEVAGGYEMVRQVPFGQEQLTCALRVESPRPAGADLAAQALSLMTAFFAADGISLADQRGGTNLLAHRVHGFSPRGWEYVELTAEARPSGAPTLSRARIMLVHHGASVIPVYGVSTHYEGCVRFDYERNLGTTFDPQLDWATFFWGLELDEVATGSSTVEQKLIGKWSDFSASSLVGEIYAANHRYASDATWAQEREISPALIEVTTTTWSGEGSYEVKDAVLARFPEHGVAESNLFHVVSRFAPPETLGRGQKNPTDELHQMRVTTLSSGARLPYELVLTRVEQ